MSICGAFMVPHPPLIVPEVGRGEENKIAATIDAYRKVAQSIAELKPETIVITSPHSVMYADYFHISPGSEADGNLGQFGAPEVSFHVAYDELLVQALCAEVQSQEIPAGTEGERDPALDHATMVPLYFIRQKYTACKYVRIGLSGLSLRTHYAFGECIARAVEKTKRRVVFVASGDLSHVLKADGPYGFHPEGPVYDERIMDVMGTADFGKLLTFDAEFCEKAAECGHRSFVIMAGALDRKAVRPGVLSHEGPFGVGYGVCRYEVTGSDEHRNFLEQTPLSEAKD
jgi:MEMO1 family protein